MARTNPTRPGTRHLAVLLAVLLAAGLALAGCTADDPADLPEAEAVAVTDAWVKAAEEGMTAAFGALTNSSDCAVTVTAATTAAAARVELHETVASDTGEMVMQEIDGGFVIPAGATLTLEPGASHLMLMGLIAPISAGEDVTVTLTFADGSTLEFTGPAKEFSGANENYEDGAEMAPGH